MNNFFNTVSLQGEQLRIMNEKAKSQEDAILQIFKAFPKYSFRTFDIEQLLKKQLFEASHDGVKRAITVLQQDGKLIRSEKACCPGPYGVPVNVWQLNTSKA